VHYILAIDAGTTGVRAVVFDERGEPTASAYHELTTTFPRPGWAEQDAEHIWQTTTAVIRDTLARSGLEPAAIAAVGIANQRSSIVAWDAESLVPLSPMILWHDVRTVERCLELAEQGFYVQPSMAVSKAEWIIRHFEAASEAAARSRLRLGGMESWLCARLTGGFSGSDHANASATGFYAHLERGWDSRLLEALGIDAACMPELVESSGDLARTSAEVFGAAVPLAGMCGDQQASLYGLACTSVGETKCSYGTSAMVDVNTGSAIAIGGAGTYPLVAWSDGTEATYCVEGSVNTAGAAVQWLRDGAGIVSDASETAALAHSVSDSGGVWAVPAFQGLGTPYGEPRARAMIGGLSRGSTRAHIARALLEGIAHRVVDVAESVWQASEHPATVLRADGGASRNDFLMQSQADLLGMPVELSPLSDGAALGAAGLAAAGVGLGSAAQTFAVWKPTRVFEPLISLDERASARELWRRRLEIVANEPD
jgi:glycerol kinase